MLKGPSHPHHLHPQSLEQAAAPPLEHEQQQLCLEQGTALAVPSWLMPPLGCEQEFPKHCCLPQSFPPCWG